MFVLESFRRFELRAHIQNTYIHTYIHTYIQTLLKLPKWVFQFNTIKTYKLKFKLVKNISTIIL